MRIPRSAGEEKVLNGSFRDLRLTVRVVNIAQSQFTTSALPKHSALSLLGRAKGSVSPTVSS
jgi:hypothetical protein